MLVIFDPQHNYYFQTKEKIILFNSIEKVEWFVNNFYQYALKKCIGEDPFSIPKVMASQNNIIIKKIDFDTSKVKTINFDELVK